MERSGNVVEIGVVKPERGGPEDAPQEITAVNTVMGGVEKGLEQLVSAARKACPNPNCCLSAEVSTDTAEGGWWDPHPHNDTTYEVSFTRVEVGSKRMIGCAERADKLADGVASMVERCVDATTEADTAGKEKTDASAKKAEGVLSTAAVTRARETVKAAQTKAKEIKSGGEKEAKKARNSIYSRTKKEVIASVLQ